MLSESFVSPVRIQLGGSEIDDATFADLEAVQMGTVLSFVALRVEVNRGLVAISCD
jgi:hypothetical protein